jgi:hypothetical protein
MSSKPVVSAAILATVVCLALTASAPSNAKESRYIATEESVLNIGSLGSFLRLMLGTSSPIADTSGVSSKPVMQKVECDPDDCKRPKPPPPPPPCRPRQPCLDP